MSDNQISELVERMARSKGVEVSSGLIEEALKRVMAVLSGDPAQAAVPPRKGLDPRPIILLPKKGPILSVRPLG